MRYSTVTLKIRSSFDLDIFDNILFGDIFISQHQGHLNILGNLFLVS